jgi:hypothetical protein
MSETPVAPAEPQQETPAEPSTGDEVTRLLEEARGHLAGGIPQSAVSALIHAVELLAGSLL